jgi:DNA gyrase subunit A
MKVHELPEGTRTSKGSHIKSLLTVAPDEEITTTISLKGFTDEQYLFMGTARGVVKRVKTGEFANAKTRGIIAIKLDEGDKLVSALLTGGKDEVVFISRKGQALRTHEDQVRAMGRAGHGVRGMKLGDDDELTGLLRVAADAVGPDKETMLIVSENGYGKRVNFSEFSSHGRGSKGQKIYTVNEKTGGIVGCVTVLETEEIMCITRAGKSIRLEADGIRVMGRSAQGVRILNIDKTDCVTGVDRIVKEE